MASDFLQLLADGAGRDELDAALAGRGNDPDAAHAHGLAVRVLQELSRQRSREAELSALNETASDLIAIRDLDTILAAIVRRARLLLRADMTYLSLNDDEASYMKVTDGALTREFGELRLPLGTGLLGLVAQTGAPYFTDDYQGDERFLHRGYIDEAVANEQIRAILGVPLVVDGQVIGALLAVHRTVRSFPASEVALLTSFAAHAAVALENARLFEQAGKAVAAADRANEQLRDRSVATEQAASAHDLMTDTLLNGGGVAEVADLVAASLAGTVSVFDETGRRLAGTDDDTETLGADIVASRASGHAVHRADGSWLAVAAAGEEHLGTLVLRPRAPLDDVRRRTLERAALVTALVLLFRRTEAEADERVRGELLGDLIEAGSQDRERLAERARLHKAELAGPVEVAVAEVSGIERHRAARIAAALAAETSGLGGEHRGRVVVIGPAGARLAQSLHERLGAAGGSATVGSAENASISAGWVEAQRCADALLALGRRGEVSDPAGLGLARLLLGTSGPEELADFVAATVGPVAAYDAQRGTELIATMEAWFSHGGALRATAEELHVHPNTVTQRLDRISQLLGGPSWRSPAQALDVQLALRLRRLTR